MSRFPFRVIKASWGIAIDLDVTIATTQPEPGDVWIDDDLWLRIGHDCGQLRWPDVPFLVSGLRRIRDGIDTERPAVVMVGGVWYRPTDFQVEGLEAAIVAWAAEHFGFEAPVARVTFDPDSNRYRFEYVDHRPEVTTTSRLEQRRSPNTAQ